ncbi:MAG: MBL fold metallo-hydrolase [Planctomycetes bacterium]|nr:MBL fold metallo-hydrolase [Planctomycetota bacterium]
MSNLSSPQDENATKELESIRIGSWTATCLRDTPFWVDGGAAFHIVPRALWQKKIAPDEYNRIPVALNCLLLQNGHHNILIDAGIGERYNAKMENIYNLDRKKSLLTELAKTGITPAEIDIVILTHLHFDHTGWCMRYTSDAKKESTPTFPNARHLVQKLEWEGVKRTNELTRGSYLDDDYLPLAEAGLLEFVEGEAEVVPGLRVMLTGAHSSGHQAIVLHEESQTLFCPCEILPDIHHLRLSWVMSYDLMPGFLVDVKRTFLAAAAGGDWLLFLSHEMGEPFGRIKCVKEGIYEFESVNNKTI